MDGRVLASNNQVGILGVNFDSLMTVNRHVQVRKLAEFRKILNILDSKSCIIL